MENIEQSNDVNVISHSEITVNERVHAKYTNKKNEAEPMQAKWSEILPYFLAPAIFMAGVLGEIYFKNFFLLVWIAYVLLPVLDYLLPVDHSNVSE